MDHYKLALVGFGNVGQSLVRLLISKRDEIAAKYKLTYIITGIATGSHGYAIDPTGLDVDRALTLVNEGNGKNINELSKLPEIADSLEFINFCGADVLFENSPVNYGSGQPAVDHIKCGLQSGMNVITANKGPIVHAYGELNELANKHGVKFYFESTVMDGAPIFAIFRETLPAANVLSFRGVLNSTSNMVLTRMESGDSFNDAVRYTQQIGIAETDPSGDIDGWDAAIKTAALVTVLMDTPIKPQEVDLRGISNITVDMVRKAMKNGERWKLVCSAERKGEQVMANVSPVLVSRESPLYNVRGTSSVVTFQTDVLGLFTVLEEDPGPETTAYGCLADFLNAVRQ